MVTNLVLALFFGWLMVLSFIVYNTMRHYQELTTRTRRRSIDEILDAVLRQAETVEKNQVDLKKEISQVQSHLSGSFQKLGLVRFNAFGKTEGEPSFVIALLNERNDGVVMNFIYVHDAVRVYAKQVKAGKGDKHELSGEEKEAVEKAA